MKFFDRFYVTDRNENSDICLDIKENCDGTEILKIRIDFGENKAPDQVSVSWEDEMMGVIFAGYPSCGRDYAMRQSWCASRSPSRFGFGAPLLYTVGENSVNTCTVAVNDASTPLTIKFWVDDFPQKYKVKYEVVFFDGNCDPRTYYEADIRIDKRKIPYYDALADVYPWWRDKGYVIPDIPDAANDALYSTWYNFHQMPESNALLKDLEIAAEVGFKTVILDDGWQFEGRPDGPFYSKCGDWEVAKDKFPDFKKFTEDVHRLGMKLLLWFAVPFIGPDTKIYERFRDKILFYRNDRTFVADPRYPEVRKYLVDTYCRFLKEYNIDGFKLDFVDDIRLKEESPSYNEKMDYITVDKAVKALLNEIKTETAKIKNDLLFEYRQNYIGPAINMFGNMLRVGDCAYDSITNRTGLISLRLLGYPVAVHSDMLYWSKEESISLCAFQLLNIMFSVPQISVILADSTQEQRMLLKHFLSYWNANRDIILNGKFIPLHPENNFSSVTAEGKDKQITVLYADIPFIYNNKAADVFHNGDISGVILENPTKKQLQADIFDSFGNCLEKVTVASGELIRLAVPVRGMFSVSERNE